MTRQKSKPDNAAEPKIAAARQKIADACEGRLRRNILAGEVPIPAKKLMTISRMAPAMRRAQAKSYAETGRPLELPRYRDIVDAVLEAIHEECAAVATRGNGGMAVALAQALDTRTQVHTTGGVIVVPPLDTEKVAELIDRLDRSLGLVAKVLVDLARLHEVSATDAEKAALHERLNKITAFAGLVGDLLLHVTEASPVYTRVVELERVAT